MRANTHKNNIIKKDLAEGKRIRIKILAESLTEAQAFKLECEWIAYYGREVDGTGCLTNLTVGGEGVSGFRHSESTRKKMSEVRKSEWSDPELRRERSDANKKLWQDPSYRARLTSKRREAAQDPEYRKTLSQSMKKLGQDPSHRAALSAQRKKDWDDPDRRKAFSDFIRKRWQDPEYRQRMLDARAARKREIST